MATNLEDSYGYWLKDDDGYIRFASGTSVPSDAAAGYATGCIFQHTDGSDRTALYINEGSDSSCDFNPVTTDGFVKVQGAPTAKTVTSAITAAELITGIITTTGATGPSVHQLPTGTLLLAAVPDFKANDSFDFSVINTGTGASDDATITVNTDVTIVGNPTVGALTDATTITGSGLFRARYTGGVTWIVYRIA